MSHMVRDLEESARISIVGFEKAYINSLCAGTF